MRDFSGSIAVAAHEFCRRAEGQVQDVVKDEHLAIAPWSSADPNCRSGDLASDEVGYFAGNSFQENAGYTGAVESGCVPHELFDVGQRLALDLVSAHAV